MCDPHERPVLHAPAILDDGDQEPHQGEQAHNAELSRGGEVGLVGKCCAEVGLVLGVVGELRVADSQNGVLRECPQRPLPQLEALLDVGAVSFRGLSHARNHERIL